MKKLLIFAALIGLAGSALAEDTMKSIVVKPDGLTWKDNPALSKGAQVAVILGDPTKSGEVVVQRVKFPPNFQIMPHTHPYSEVVTVISGSVGVGMGEKFEKKGEMLKAGSLWMHPAKHAHYGWTGNEGAIIQVQFTGPGGIDYINPADDPRKK
jgi:quercetin dioxygenase-like cupin family protein